MNPTTQVAAADFVDPDETIDPNEAAAILRVEPQTLATWRSQNRGPTYYKVGHFVRYARKDLGRFVAANKIVPGSQVRGR